jgi:TolB-like protein
VAFRFDEFELDVAASRLLRNGLNTGLDARPLALLRYLISHRNRAVPRDELLREVWSGVTVSDAALNSALRDLRRALGDSGADQHFVRTLRGVGFRFVSDVSVIRGPERGLPAPPFAERSVLAVVPLFSLSDDPHDDLFALGITEDLCIALSGNPHLAVISHRTTSSLGREVPLEVLRRELGVRYVVEGTARQVDGRVRVTASLVDAQNGRQLVASRCDREVGHVLEIQQALAEELLRALGSEVREIELERVRRKAKYDPEGFEHFREGWRLFNLFRRTEEARARECFQAAIDREPKLAEAHAMLGGSYSKEYGFGWTDDLGLVERARRHVANALELDPTAAECHVVQAGIHISDRDFTAAERAAMEALHFNPSHDVAYLFLGSALRAQGELARAEQAAEMCRRLNPRALSPYRNLDGVVAYLQGRVEEAVAIWEALRADNADLIMPRLLLALHHERGGDHTEAATCVNEALLVNEQLSVDYATRLMGSGDPNLAETLRRAGLR